MPEIYTKKSKIQPFLHTCRGSVGFRNPCKFVQFHANRALRFPLTTDDVFATQPSSQFFVLVIIMIPFQVGTLAILNSCRKRQWKAERFSQHSGMVMFITHHRSLRTILKCLTWYQQQLYKNIEKIAFGLKLNSNLVLAQCIFYSNKVRQMRQCLFQKVYALKPLYQVKKHHPSISFIHFKLCYDL